jgi:Holliday junction DNA helicase RuvA
MIAKLSGILESVGEDGIVIDVGGVGYLLSCSAATVSRLPGVGEAASLVVETHVREDRIQLYGFADRAEREWFRRLLTVQGVGAKVALSILSALRPNDLLQALMSGDKAMLSRADGVGPKLAARVINELKDRVAKLAAVPAAAPAAGVAANDDANAAVSALVNLGYRRAEAFGAITHAAQRLGGQAALADLIRAGLQELGR